MVTRTSLRGVAFGVAVGGTGTTNRHRAPIAERDVGERLTVEAGRLFPNVTAASNFPNPCANA
jgi:hypothetical protein